MHIFPISVVVDNPITTWPQNHFWQRCRISKQALIEKKNELNGNVVFYLWVIHLISSILSLLDAWEETSTFD